MSIIKDTSQSFSRREFRSVAKHVFRSAIDLFPGVTAKKIADLCDENESTVKAWIDPARDHSPPWWAIVRIKQKMLGFGTFLEVSIEQRLGLNPNRPTLTLEERANVVDGAIANVLSVEAAGRRGDNRFDKQETESLAVEYARMLAVAREGLQGCAERLNVSAESLEAQ